MESNNMENDMDEILKEINNLKGSQKVKRMTFDFFSRLERCLADSWEPKKDYYEGLKDWNKLWMENK